MNSMLFLAILLAIFASVDAFHRPLLRPQTSSTRRHVWLPVNTLVVAVTQAAGDVVYGSVNAPSWALPLGAVIVIATAAIPVSFTTASSQNCHNFNQNLSPDPVAAWREGFGSAANR